MDYLKFFDLTAEPFQNHPDPSMYYESHAQRVARLRVMRGLEQRRGLMLVTGPAGCGKTTLATQLTTALRGLPYQFHIRSVPHSSCADGWLLPEISRALGAPEVPNDPARTLDQLQKALLLLRASGQHFVLVMDEAQLLAGPQALQEFRSLLNLAESGQPLLSIVLIGLGELGDALAADPSLEQRIDIRVQLSPMETAEAIDYLAHRLTRVGSSRDIFASDALEALACCSGGVPRILNTLADTALFEASLCQIRPVSCETVVAAADQLGLGQPGSTTPAEAPSSEPASTPAEDLVPHAAASTAPSVAETPAATAAPAPPVEAAIRTAPVAASTPTPLPAATPTPSPAAPSAETVAAPAEFATTEPSTSLRGVASEAALDDDFPALTQSAPSAVGDPDVERTPPTPEPTSLAVPQAAPPSASDPADEDLLPAMPGSIESPPAVAQTPPAVESLPPTPDASAAEAAEPTPSPLQAAADEAAAAFESEEEDDEIDLDVCLLPSEPEASAEPIETSLEEELSFDTAPDLAIQEVAAEEAPIEAAEDWTLDPDSDGEDSDALFDAVLTEDPVSPPTNTASPATSDEFEEDAADAALAALDRDFSEAPASSSPATPSGPPEPSLAPLADADADDDDDLIDMAEFLELDVEAEETPAPKPQAAQPTAAAAEPAALEPASDGDLDDLFEQIQLEEG